MLVDSSLTNDNREFLQVLDDSRSSLRRVSSIHGSNNLLITGSAIGRPGTDPRYIRGQNRVNRLFWKSMTVRGRATCRTFCQRSSNLEYNAQNDQSDSRSFGFTWFIRRTNKCGRKAIFSRTRTRVYRQRSTGVSTNNFIHECIETHHIRHSPKVNSIDGEESLETTILVNWEPGIHPRTSGQHQKHDATCPHLKHMPG